MSSIRSRALVLTAGLGSRLRPLTLDVPKPLLPVLGRPLIFHTLDCLRGIGCEAVVLNLHHLGERVSAAVGERFVDLPVTYSREPTLLGTLGGIVAVKEFLVDCDVALVVNGDSLCDWPLEGLIERHLSAAAEATLFVHTAADPNEFGGVGVREGTLVSLPPDRVPADARPRVFAGAHAFKPELIQSLEAGLPDLVPHLYRPMLTSGRSLAAFEAQPPWHDLGTPERYLAAVLDWVGESGWAAPSAQVDGSSQFIESVAEDGCRVAARARIEGSLLLQNSRIGEHASLRRALVGPGVVVPDGCRIENAMLTRNAAGGFDERPLEIG